MKIVITGGTGLIGRPLVNTLLNTGHQVTVLTRTANSRLPAGARAVVWPGTVPIAAAEVAAESGWQSALDGADAVVHLAGEPIASRRWSKEQRERILQSRVQVTRTLVAALAGVKRKPGVLVSGSAVGYYGHRIDGEVTEADSPGRDFLSKVCQKWEQEACKAGDLGIRVVLLRTGIVLGKKGGALPRMLLPFRLFVGGPLGSGKQWMPWVHLDDMIGLICFLIQNKTARGPVNAVAPNPVTNLDFSRTLGRVLGRPSWAPVPGPVLRLALGEMAGALLLSGQKVIPHKALELGYNFKYCELEPALSSILKHNN